MPVVDESFLPLIDWNSNTQIARLTMRMEGQTTPGLFLASCGSEDSRPTEPASSTWSAKEASTPSIAREMANTVHLALGWLVRVQNSTTNMEYMKSPNGGDSKNKPPMRGIGMPLNQRVCRNW